MVLASATDGCCLAIRGAVGVSVRRVFAHSRVRRGRAPLLGAGMDHRDSVFAHLDI